MKAKPTNTRSTKTAAKKTPAKVAKKASAKAAEKAPARKTPGKQPAVPKKPRIYAISFASVYPLYVQKAANKARTKEEVDAIIEWLTGYGPAQLQRVIDAKLDLEAFFAQAPRINPKAGLIEGVVCGVRVEDIADPLTRKIRYLDKLIDELARGKKMDSILRR